MDNATKAKAEEPELIPEFAKPEIQEARAFLRERFLTFINGIVCKFIINNIHEHL